MRNFIVIILVALMCFSLVSCNDTSEGQKLAGKWLGFSGPGFVFNSDGTGVLDNHGNKSELTWKYDKDLDVYVLATSFGTVNLSMKTDGDETYLLSSGNRLYSEEVFKQKLPEKLAEAGKTFSDKISGREKIELGKEYSAENILVKFDLKIEDGALWLYEAITNNGDQEITLDNRSSQYCPVYAGYGVEYYRGEWSNSVGGFGLNLVFDGDLESIAPGESGVIKIQLVDNAQWVIDTFGKMIGYVSCSVGDDTENKYISFEDMYSASKS